MDTSTGRGLKKNLKCLVLVTSCLCLLACMTDWKNYTLISILICCFSVSDHQYEVRVWAFNKQTDGAAAVWKGRTDKAHDKRKISLCINLNNYLEQTSLKIQGKCLCCCVQHPRHPCAPLHCLQAASKLWPTAPPPSGCAGRNQGSAT